MNNLFDIACNFSSERFDKDLDEVIQRAKNNKVSKFLVVSASLNDTEKVNGIYKDNIDTYKPNSVGETGLDFFRNISSYEEQIFAFEEQIKIAIDKELPLFLHQREAHDDFIKILSKYRNSIPKSVVHCFTGTQKELDDYLDIGCHIGLTGWICDANRNIDLRKSLINIPLDKLMIETDCPYLIPKNLQEKPKNNRNEPAFLPHIAKEISSLVNVDIDQLVKKTYENSIKFFS